MQGQVIRNIVLRNLSPVIIERLQLKQVRLPVPQDLEIPGEELRRVIFLEDGVASMTTVFLDGTEVEVALAGYESVLGASSLFATHRSLNRVYMQIAGWGYSTSRALATEEFNRHGEFQQMVLRYSQAQFIQTAQTAACNARHSSRQRLARWLLLCSDRMQTDVLELSQDFTSTMLGIRRQAINAESVKLQAAGVIKYSRNKIQIVDQEALRRTSCECYAAVIEHLKNYESADQGFGG